MEVIKTVQYVRKVVFMKEIYITITGMKYYYGLKPFSVGKKIKCIKEKNNPYDDEAIKVVMKEIGTVGYVANAPYTVATGTMSAGRLYEKVKKKFVVEVMFITSSQIICRVVDGFKGQTEKETVEICLKKKPFDTNDTICRE